MTKSQKLYFHRSVKSNLKIMAVFLAIGFPMLSGCSHTEQILIPSQMDLMPHGIIGVIEFSSNREAELKQYGDPELSLGHPKRPTGSALLGTGNQDLVLSKVSCERLDYESITLIGRHYHGDAILFGDLDLSEPKPKVSLSSTWKHPSLPNCGKPTAGSYGGSIPPMDKIRWRA